MDTLMQRPIKHPVPEAVTVIIPVFNNSSTIEVQLNALAKQNFTGRIEVIVSDNGSTDGMPDLVSTHPLRESLHLRWIDSSSVRGECHARNRAVEAARYDFIACCDADDMVDSNWLSALADSARYDDLIGGQLEGEKLNDAHVRNWRSVPKPGALPVRARFLPFAQGCNTAFWKSAWTSIGGFDESTIAGGGDIEFCWRAQLHGLTLGYSPAAIVSYRYRTTLRSSWQQVVAYGQGEATIVKRYCGIGAKHEAPHRLILWLLFIGLWCPVFPWAWSRSRLGSWVWATGGLWGCLYGGAKNRIVYF